ncbi:GAF domain-containing protein [candidate division KSB1 bacterium]|nr:GAF domain-containing protein [candidate division KSB1 bacterium]
MLYSNPPATMPPTNSTQHSLTALAKLYERHATLDALLQTAAQIAAEILAVEYCGIAWLEDDRTNFRVRTSFGTNGVNGHEERTSRLVAKMIHENNHANHGISKTLTNDNHSENFLAASLHVKEKLVGYLVIMDVKKCTSADESLLAMLSEHTGFAIEMHNMRQMLASSYLVKTLGLGKKKGVSGQNGFNSHMLTAVAEPEKVATIIARTFYKDLRKAGFESGQILTVATELIGNLTEALHKTNVKTKLQPTKPKIQMNPEFQNPNSKTEDACESFGIGF